MDDIDLIDGVLPISAAASRLARLIVQTRATGKPIVVTQKGSPQAVILDVRAYVTQRAELSELAELRRRLAELEGR
jgi:prevent-host-death family protein